MCLPSQGVDWFSADCCCLLANRIFVVTRITNGVSERTNYRTYQARSDCIAGSSLVLHHIVSLILINGAKVVLRSMLY